MDKASTSHGKISSVVGELERAIIFGNILPRQRITEDEIVHGMGVKRHVARGALMELERLGMITREPFKGAAVRSFSRQEVRDLYEVREVLHRQAALRIRRLGDAAWLAALERLHEEHQQAVARLDLMAVFKANRAFHDTLFQGTDNPHFAQAIEYSNALTHCIRSHALKHQAFLTRATAEHRAMIEHVKNRDLEALSRLCVAHMQPARRYYEETFCDLPTPSFGAPAEAAARHGPSPEPRGSVDVGGGVA